MPDDADEKATARSESTVDLLEKAHGGDRRALDRLCERFLPRLRTWARGRIPNAARDLVDTEDLVQDVLAKTVQRMEGENAPNAGSFPYYLRRALANRIVDECRRTQRQPSLNAAQAEDLGPRPIDHAIGPDRLARYESALAKLRPLEREAVVARVELRLSYEEIAELLEKPSANAARMTVIRAMEKLLEEMDDDR